MNCVFANLFQNTAYVIFLLHEKLVRTLVADNEVNQDTDLIS